MSSPLCAPALRTLRRLPWALLAGAACVLVAGSLEAQEPLFTFVQTSDSQAGSETEWQRFENVLACIAASGKPGALLPRKANLVLFAGDITEANENAEWIRCRGLFDTYLTANGFPLLCVPGNRDQGSSAGTAQLYQQYIGSSGVWDVSSASFTGQNGITGNTGWAGLRIIGFNNANGAWNKISDADVTLIQSRVTAAAAANENIFLFAHHPHDGQSRIPLATILTNPAIVGYVRGHSGSPSVKQGLSGVNNPNVWDLNSNAIVDDTDLLYYEVFSNQIKVYMILLPMSQLPSAKTIPLVFPLTPPLAVNIGYQDASHSSARPWPSGSAPEKKLWSQGGNWFGVLWHEASLSYRIFRLDTFAQSWVDTGTVVSSTASRSFDALATGTRLYLASHVVSVPSAPGSGSPGQVQRYTYNSTTRSYAPDAGFPVAVNDARTESLSLALDSLGTLWASWTEGGEVLVNRTVGGNDTTWAGPVLLPFPEADGLDPEDVSALVAFDGKVGCLWTDKIGGRLLMAVRDDGASATTWLLESALASAGNVADTLDVATSGGKLYVATSTPGGAQRLLRRDVGAAGSGAWALFTVADAATGLSQPIVLVDETQNLVRVFATGAAPSGGGSLGGGVVYEKDAPLATLAFPPGKGTVVIQDGSNFAMGRPSSTRQALSATTALAVLASNELSQRTWHMFASLGTPPVAPSSDFSGSPRSGTAPLIVHFSDLSSGSPTDWLWDFGDGTSATVPSPDHAYAQPGSYTVSLRAANSAGSDTRTRSAYVVVSPPSNPNPTTVTLTAIADTTANEQNRNTNHGMATIVRVSAVAGRNFRSYLKFDLAGVTGTITAAKLRLYVTDASENGGSVHPITSSWSETTLTWANQPTLPTTNPIAALGAVALNTWVEADVTAGVSGTGQVSLLVAGGNTNIANYTSREGANKPQLVLTLQPQAQPPVADFAGTPLAGVAPLTVQFTDLSTGTPTSWQWSFGDGATSTQQSPQHVYSSAGTYTVALQAGNASGSNTRTRSSYVAVSTPPTGGNVFLPVADARTHEGNPTTNYGLDTLLRMKTQAGSTYRSYLKFDLSSLGGAPSAAKLRMFVTDESNSGGSIYLVSNSWTETGVNWSIQPTLPLSPVATAGAAPLGTWVEFDVKSVLLGPGIVSFALAGGTTNSVYYWSREGTNPPELVITP